MAEGARLRTSSEKLPEEQGQDTGSGSSSGGGGGGGVALKKEIGLVSACGIIVGELSYPISISAATEHSYRSSDFI